MKNDTLLLTRITKDGPDARVPRRLLTLLLDAAYRRRRRKPAAMDVLVAGDGAMAVLNRRHLGKNRATDVLAFDDGEPEPRGGRVRLGDVAVNADAARREAAARNMRFEHELAFYALHGLFHLLGMRDGDDAGRRAMLEAQAEEMRRFGLPAPATE